MTAPDVHTVHTFCRICEPSCGLVATVDGGRLVDLAPDRDHPVTRGFACHKGLAAVEVHHDPDRLDHPMRRRADGSWETLDWETAIGFAAERLAGIAADHGPGAIAAYIGNPSAFNALGSQHVGHLLRGLGVRKTFSSGTQDCANKFVASEAVFGSSNVHPIPDLDHTDLCLVIGENPRASQASFYSIPNVLGRMRRAAGRGARFVFINPRRIETPERGVGETLLITPDTDVWFLASLLSVIDELGGFDVELVRRHGVHLDGLRAFVAAYPPERTAAVTGIDPAVVRELAAAWVSTPRASVHASTGLNMGRQGTLAYWLVHMLSFVTGRLDVAGGNLKSDGFYPNARAGAGRFEQGFVETEFGTLRRGPLPGTLMSHAILDAADPIRAMIVVSGNPLLSIAGEERLRTAFEQLEFLMVIDIYPNATAESADLVLPATDMYERDDLNIVNIGTSDVPFAQYTPAVVQPGAERRPEWWIAQRLLQALGRPSLFDDDGSDATGDEWGKYRHLLSAGSGIDLDELRTEATDGSRAIRVLEPPTPGRFFDVQVQTDDGRVDCCPTGFSAAIERCHRLFEETERRTDDGRLLLIHKRDPWMHNSWFANVERMRRRRGGDPLSIHPLDAQDRGLMAGDEIIVVSDHGEVRTTVDLDEDLKRGVVAMVHGGGHRLSPRLRVAAASPGANPNALLPVGPDSFEPLSSQAHMTGIRVEVRAVTA